MAELGIGSGVFYGDTTPDTEIVNCKSITLPKLEFTAVPTSNLGTTGNVETFIPAKLAKPSKLSAEVLYTHTVSTALLAIEGLAKKWKVVIAGSASNKNYTFDGFITGVDRKVSGHEDLDMITVEVQMTGPITAS